MMKSLYCFRVNNITGQITKYEVPEDQIKKVPHALGISSHDKFIFPGNFIASNDKKYYVERQKLNRYVSHKLFTFDPDFKAAKKLIMKALEEKSKKALMEHKRDQALLLKVKYAGEKNE